MLHEPISFYGDENAMLSLDVFDRLVVGFLHILQRGDAFRADLEDDVLRLQARIAGVAGAFYAEDEHAGFVVEVEVFILELVDGFDGQVPSGQVEFFALDFSLFAWRDREFDGFSVA